MLDTEPEMEPPPGSGLDDERRARYSDDQRAAVLRAMTEYAPEATVVFNVDFGHTDPQLVLPIGGRVRIDWDSPAASSSCIRPEPNRRIARSVTVVTYLTYEGFFEQLFYHCLFVTEDIFSSTLHGHAGMSTELYRRYHPDQFRRPRPGPSTGVIP